MFTLTSHITIGDQIDLTFVNEVSINQSWKQLTDTAEIRLPRNLKLQKDPIKDVIKKDDKVTIELGYDNELVTEFTGFVSEIHPDVPIIIKCEDEMRQQKKNPVNMSFKSVTLADLITAIAPGITNKYIAMASLRINDATPAQVFTFLRDQYGLVTYFVAGRLYSGFAYQNPPNDVQVHFQKNVKSSQRLEYRFKDEQKIRVKAISMLPDNKKLEATVGDDDGELRTLTFFNITSEATLKKRAEAELDKLKVDGYRGDVVLFGQPFAQHGDRLELLDDAFPERQDTNFIDKTVTTFGQSGYQRICSLGKSAA